jgi:ABC-type sugar transport system permease subunit
MGGSARIGEVRALNRGEGRPGALWRLQRWWNKTGMWYFFVAPAVVLLLVFMAYPLVDGLSLSIFKWDGIAPRKMIGLGNFEKLVTDDLFWDAVWHTFLFAVVATLGTVGIGFILATVISRRVPGWKLFRMGYYLPVMLSLVVVGLLWRRMYEYNWGLVNTLLRAIGLDAFALPWLADPKYTLNAVMVVPIWQYSAFPMIVILAAIENIPQDLHDAATIDGVNEWQRARFLMFPLIRPVVASISMLQLIFSLKVFDLIWVMTPRGDPAGSSMVLGLFLYMKGFFNHDFGYASAVAMVMFVIVFAMTYLYQRVVKIDVVEY